MKKTYYQTNIFYQLLLMLFLCVSIVLQIYAILAIFLIIEKFQIGRIVVFLIFEIMAILIFILFFRLENYNIYINDNVVFMKDDRCRKNEKIQFKTVVNIKDIKSIDIIWTPKNSKQNGTPVGTIGKMLPKAYISFTSIDGKINNMFILYMSKNTLKHLIDDIKYLMVKNNNMNVIEDTENLLSKFTLQLSLRRKK